MCNVSLFRDLFSWICGISKEIRKPKSPEEFLWFQRFTSPKPSLMFLPFSLPVLSYYLTQGKPWSSSSIAVPVYSAAAGFLGFS